MARQRHILEGTRWIPSDTSGDVWEEDYLRSYQSTSQRGRFSEASSAQKSSDGVRSLRTILGRLLSSFSTPRAMKRTTPPLG